MSSIQPSRRFYLLTMPRTASNLLVKMLGLADQPDIIPRYLSGYFFMKVAEVRTKLKLEGKHVDEWTSEEKAAMMQCYQECADEFLTHIQRAESEGKITLVKEHTFLLAEPAALSHHLFPDQALHESPWTVSAASETRTRRSQNNWTIYTDEFLQTFSPIFLIRHPALMFPSFLRKYLEITSTSEKDPGNEMPEKEIVMTLKWSRALYDFYTEQFNEVDSSADGDSSLRPIIVDADDVVNHPDVVVRLCEVTGLDKTKLKREWEPATQAQLAEQSDRHNAMLSSVLASSGVMKDKTAKDLDLGAEAAKWRDEFGDAYGKELEKCVMEAMPDYEFLRSKRLMPTE